MNGEIQILFSVLIGLALLGLIALWVGHLLGNLWDLVLGPLLKALRNACARRLVLLPIPLRQPGTHRESLMTNNHARPP